VPSYGVPAPSGSLPALAITDNSTLDITDCANLNVLLTIGSTTTAVPTSQVAVHAQTNGPPICVIKYGTITINDPYTLTIANSATLGHALTLEATGDIDISGKLAFFNAAQGPAPGGTASTLGLNSNNKYMAPGAGGAGAARAGGFGGKCVACNGGADVNGAFPGDPVTTAATILDGGSVGGHVYNGSSIVAYGGAGGGGLHLVSLTRVTMPASAVINLNGGAGTGPGLTNNNETAGGGGSGGTLVVEAPVINVSAGAIAAANGGGGAGGCWYSIVQITQKFFHYNGQPGQLSTTRAAGGDCPNTSNGDGGYEANGDTAPSINGQPSDANGMTVDGGGGGGSSGFIILRGRNTTNVMIAFGAIISPAPTMGAVTAQ
jgi:hypothetical protein